ncbi:tetratricopeptide repeat protein 41-like [Aplochiton taeniatus]
MNPQWDGGQGGYYPIPLQPVLCSVPGDFPQEWNYLKTQVFPHLNDLCQAKRTCFRPVDIHWEESGSLHPSDPSHNRNALSSQQLKITLDLISQSSSFICLLGQKYGPHQSEDSPPLPEPGPEQEDLSGMERNLCVAAEGGYPWVLTGNHPTCSLTELQITKAALLGEPRHCFFYFKDYSLQEEEEDGEGQRRLLQCVSSRNTELERDRIRALKNMIVEKLQPVKFFRTLKDLGDLVMQDWRSLIEFINGPQPSHLVCEKSDCEPERSILLLSGERGCGKSSLAAWWLQDFGEKNPTIPVIPYFCGISNSSVDIGSVLKHLTMELHRGHYGSQSEWQEGLHGLLRNRPLHTVVQAFLAAAALRPCVLMLDGLDHLTGTSEFSMQEVKELLWLPVPLPPQCKLIITTSITDLTYKSLTQRPDLLSPPWALLSDHSACRSILLKHLILPSQEPSNGQFQYYLAGRLAHLPLYLAVVASELLTCGVARGEVEKEVILEDYAAFDSVAELWMLVVRRWLKDYSSVHVVKSHTAKETGPLYPVVQAELQGWVWDTLCLIHLSRAGLTEEEVWALLELLGHRDTRQVLPVEWARFRSATKRWVQESPDGALNLSHQSLGQAIDILLLKVKPSKNLKSLRRTRQAYQLTLAQFLQKQTKELCRWPEGLELVPWLFEQSKSWKQLHAYLTDPEAIEPLSISWSQSSQLRTDVVRYWSVLITKGYDPFTSYKRLFRNGSCRPSLYETENLSGPQLELNGIKGNMADYYKAETYCKSALKSTQTLMTLCPAGYDKLAVCKGQLLCTLCKLLFAVGRILEAYEVFCDIINMRHHRVHPCAEATVLLLQVMCSQDKIEQHLQTALRIRKNWYGREHPLVVEVKERLADTLAESRYHTA